MPLALSFFGNSINFSVCVCLYLRVFAQILLGIYFSLHYFVVFFSRMQTKNLYGILTNETCEFSKIFICSL
jgi:hypothetical protein